MTNWADKNRRDDESSTSSSWGESGIKKMKIWHRIPVHSSSAQRVSLRERWRSGTHRHFKDSSHVSRHENRGIFASFSFYLLIAASEMLNSARIRDDSNETRTNDWMSIHTIYHRAKCRLKAKLARKLLVAAQKTTSLLTILVDMTVEIHINLFAFLPLAALLLLSRQRTHVMLAVVFFQQIFFFFFIITQN